MKQKDGILSYFACFDVEEHDTLLRFRRFSVSVNKRVVEITPLIELKLI